MHSGPSCPDGFSLYGSTCLLIVDDPLSWSLAYIKCQESGSELFMAKTISDQAVLKANMKSTADLWLGGWEYLDIENTISWMWVDNTKFTYTNWVDDSFALDHCLLINNSTYKWDDKDCTEVHSYICSKPQGSDASPRWIGLTDKASLKTFEWSDQKPVIYTHWGTGMPSTSGGNGPVCSYINSLDSGWRHSECDEKKVS